MTPPSRHDKQTAGWEGKQFFFEKKNQKLSSV
jgi:hypothetical protein